MLRVIVGAGQGGGPTLAPVRYRTARQAVASPVTGSNDTRCRRGFQAPGRFEMLGTTEPESGPGGEEDDDSEQAS